MLDPGVLPVGVLPGVTVSGSSATLSGISFVMRRRTRLRNRPRSRAQLEKAQHEIRRLKYHRGRVKNALLEGVKLAEILAKFFGVAKK